MLKNMTLGVKQVHPDYNFLEQSNIPPPHLVELKMFGGRVGGLKGYESGGKHKISFRRRQPL